MRKLLLSSLLSLVGCLFPATLRGQFIGYTSPQTVQTTLANGTGCTGSPQIFTAPNLGQTQHYASIAYTGVTTPNQMEIDGVDVPGNIYRISDVVMLNSTTAVVTASGYFPKVQIRVTCASTGTFTLSYMGASSVSNVNAGVYQSSQIDKIVFQGSSTGSAQSTSVQTPFGSSQGTMLFTYSGTGTSITVTLSCFTTLAGLPGYDANLLSITPATTTTNTQVFQIPAIPCPTLAINTNAVAGTFFNLEYIFAPTGAPSVSDPCQSSAIPKSSAAINVTTATTTQLVPISGVTSIYVCGASLTIAPSGTSADTATFEYGTGASCGTGTTALTGAFGAGDLTTTTGLLFVTLADPGTSFKTPQGQALCLLSAGTTVNIQGVMTYVQM